MGLLGKIFSGAKKVAGIGKYIPGPMGTVLSATDVGSKKGNFLKNLGGEFGNRVKIAVPLALGGAGGPGMAGAGGAGAANAGGLGMAGAAGTSQAGPGILSRVFGGAKKYGPDILQAGIAGYGAFEGARAQRAGDKRRQQAIDLAMQAYNENAPLRARQRQLLLQAPSDRPDLSATYRSSENPFY